MWAEKEKIKLTELSNRYRAALTEILVELEDDIPQQTLLVPYYKHWFYVTIPLAA